MQKHYTSVNVIKAAKLLILFCELLLHVVPTCSSASRIEVKLKFWVSFVLVSVLCACHGGVFYE